MFVDINLYHGAATVPLKSIRFTAPANPIFKKFGKNERKKRKRNLD